MAQFIKIYPNKPNEEKISEAVKILKNGGLIIYPTDTVYGLGCDINNSKALERIAKIKGIKIEKAKWSFIFFNLSHLSQYTRPMSTHVFKILKKSLPGPYTFILNSSSNLPKDFKKKNTIGVRIPNNQIILELTKQLGNPIISTSIHDEDEVIEYTTDPELIFEKWQNVVDVVIDGGYGNNVASTVIDLTENTPIVLREGKGNLDILD